MIINTPRTRPIYDTLINAGKFPVAGIIPSAIQGTIATVHLLASVISLIAIGTIGFASSRFLSTENQERFSDWTNNCIINTAVASLALGSSVLNVLSLTYFNRNYL